MVNVKNILVAFDGSMMGKEALRRAADIAGSHEAKLLVVSVIEPPLAELSYAEQVSKEQTKAILTEVIEKEAEKSGLEPIIFIEHGSAVETIMKYVEKSRADLLVLGSHGREKEGETHIGTTTLKLVQHTHIPVLVVKKQIDSLYEKMVIPTDLSGYSLQSILFAEHLFPGTGKKYLYGYRIINGLSAQTYRISEAERVSENEKIRQEAESDLAQIMVECGEGDREVFAYDSWLNRKLLEQIEKEDADLLVLGSRGVDDLNSFVFGSVAAYLLQHTSIDVLAYVQQRDHKD